MRFVSTFVLFVSTILPQGLFAAFAGSYSCANGNPGNAFDYGDIGAFFNDLEAQGVSGPVTLNVFDDGGPFVSTASYSLGLSGAAQGVIGLSLANPLLVRAAAGERPIITGSGCSLATTQGPAGTLGLVAVSYVTLEGLEIRGGVEFGIGCYVGVPALPQERVRISGCWIHDIADGAGIRITGQQSVRFNAVTIENNMLWNIRGVAAGAPVRAAMEFFDPGLEWKIRYNTILITQTTSFSGAFAIFGGAVEEVVSNVVHLSNSQTAWLWFSDVTFPALFADYNVYHLTGAGARFGPAMASTFAAWQASGRDANGAQADPQLVNIVAGLEDLHLLPTSPARDRSAVVAVNGDIDDQLRPQGNARDSGADEYWPPDIVVEYAAAPVPVAGVVNVGGIGLAGAARTFTVRNLGGVPLNLTFNPPVVIVPGANCAPATDVQAQPAALIAPGSFTTFTLFLQPSGLGPLDLSVVINNNDPVKNPYTFTVNATGVPPNQPARANVAAGSTFAGNQNGPFQCPMQPGAALANATLELTDTELDLITVLSITPPATPLTGVTPPGIGTPAHPRVLTWSGTANASNAPGNYTWSIQFRDAVNQSVITISVTIQILNLAPTHPIAGAQGGDGSMANPYQCGFDRGDDGGASVNLCTVTDPNTGQTPFISQTVKAGTNPGTVNFTFTLTAGTLSIAPAAMLTVAEAGQHDYQVQVADGVNTTGIYVVIIVASTPMSFATPSGLPDGTTGTAYTATLTVTGAIGAVMYAVTAGAMPPDLALNPGTGQITGTPGTAMAANFTIEAEDATGATASRAFQLTINNPPAPPPPDQRATGDDGCAAGAGSLPWLVTAALALFSIRRKRRCSDVRAL